DSSSAQYASMPQRREAVSTTCSGGWLAAVAGNEQATFRHAPLRTEDLLAVLENHDESARRRVAAALILAKRGEGRTRIRIAAESAVARSFALHSKPSPPTITRQMRWISRRLCARPKQKQTSSPPKLPREARGSPNRLASRGLRTVIERWSIARCIRVSS